MTTTDALTDALDALEYMVEQYLHVDAYDGKAQYEHDFMSAGELACDVLATLRPDTWRLTPAGAIHTPAPPVDTNADGTATEAAVEAIYQRAVQRATNPRPPDADHYTVTYRLNDTADVERQPDISHTTSAVHHWLAMGAQRVEVTRHD